MKLYNLPTFQGGKPIMFNGDNISPDTIFEVVPVLAQELVEKYPHVKVFSEICESPDDTYAARNVHKNVVTKTIKEGFNLLKWLKSKITI